MRRGRRLYAVAAVLLASLGLVACETSDPEAEKAAATEAEWAWLQEAKAELDGKREELKALQDQIANYVPAEEGEAEAAGEGEAAEAPPTLEELEAQAQEALAESIKLADAFGTRLASFINDMGVGVNSERTPMQKQAFDMKAQEDILVAEEYIDKGGEYSKAIGIYTQSLVYDPTNERLLAAKALAEELQYMSEERFAQVKKGMTREEVRALLGTPKASNIREYKDRGTTGWFYAKEGRAAAGVFFQEKKGELRVVTLDFNAIKAGDEDES